MLSHSRQRQGKPKQGDYYRPRQISSTLKNLGRQKLHANLLRQPTEMPQDKRWKDYLHEIISSWHLQ